MKILWVEDNTRFAQVAGRYLAGHDVTLAPSLWAAREALRTWPFEAILLDFDLEDGKGSELLPSVQVLEPRPFVVAASSHEAGNEVLLAAGADAMCSKSRFHLIAASLADVQGGR